MATRIDLQNAPRIDLDGAKQAFDRGGPVLFVDVRSRAEYELSHIAGALGMPLRELFTRLDELPKEAEIILY